jgi:hypothetical protein
MSQATYTPDVSDNDAAALSFFNNVFAAIASNNAGNTEPTETYPYMIWADTSGAAVAWKVRNAANNGWGDLFKIATQAVAEAGTDNSDFMTALGVKQAIDATAASSRVLLATTVVSDDQFADFILPAETYSYYEMVFRSLTHNYTVATGRNIGVRVSTDGGATYKNTGYSSMASTSYVDGVALTASQVYVGYTNDTDGLTGTMQFIPDANGMALLARVVNYNSPDANRVNIGIAKALFYGPTVNAIRIGVDSTSYNLKSGTIELYGLK